ncbi:Hypothetical protein A7982_07550 [Minicystis rosea]|nr:Hypothetical protein A7982_07550 [Minicystis rosea]
MGVSYGTFGSRLVFGDGPTVDIQRRALSASFEYRLSGASTIGAGLGAGLGGLFTIGDTRFDVSPGWLVTATWSRRLVDPVGRKPFLLVGVSGGVSGATTRQALTRTEAPSASLYAVDVRVAMTVGKTFFDVLTPYASARAFGGPVFWKYRDKTLLGSDVYHFQIAVGLVTALPRGFDVFVDGSPGGERALTLGVGKSL